MIFSIVQRHSKRNSDSSCHHTFHLGLLLNSATFLSHSFANFSALSVGSPQCYLKYDYIDKLYLQTLAPIAAVALLGIAFSFHMKAVRNTDVTFQSEIIARYLTLFFILTYLVLPSTTTTIFGAFTCQSIDPDKVVSGTPLYLRNDLSISCSSTRYYLGVYWAIAMIFVYPIGITSMYAYVLYVNREDIMQACPTHVPTSFSQTATRRGPMQYITSKEIEFLHKAYEGRFWYWEVLETVRRLLLTAVLSVVTAGTLQYSSDT